MSELTVRPVTGIGDVTPGADLAALITTAAPWLADGDVVVVTSKVVSKAEGRLVPVPPDPGPARDAARDAAIDGETARVVARRGPMRIVQTHHGLVLAAAGIDESNVDRSHLVLLPADPDASAAALRARIRELSDVDVAVIVSDTMGRPWRIGQTDVAIGAAGIGAVRDYRGEPDAYGNILDVTQVAVVDELASAADLVKGKAEQVPVAVVRGLRFPMPAEGPDTVGARALVRAGPEDMFALGTAEARADGLRLAAALPDDVALGDGDLPPRAVEHALSTVGLKVDVLTASSKRVTLRPGGDPRRPARAGADIHRLRVALAAAGLASTWTDDPDTPFGTVTVGMPPALVPERSGGGDAGALVRDSGETE
jgi:coenzyme F420-0:L-glutamate ligase / coenzyme F420-1:gamma-L-glutamate ligase